MSWFPKSNIVVPVDFSDESFQAVDVALDLVDDPNHLNVIYVLQDLTKGEPGLIWNILDDAKRRDHAKTTLLSRLSDSKYKGVNVTVGIGDAGEEVANFAQKIKAELIVLPSHGRTGVARMFLGSVAERIIRLAHCPVLVLRT
jgi:nucleotide-binding universal stress UspA family protein